MLFWGRCPAENATAWFYFLDQSKYQKMVHLMKYHGRKDIAYGLGEYFGASLLETPYENADLLIPVPLHPSRQKQRGYNQSESIAQGMSSSLKIPVCPNTLVRTRANPTQTRKSGFARWENVEKIFRVQHPERLEGKHLLLVDDVITTGATLDACANTLQGIPGVRISLAALACV